MERPARPTQLRPRIRGPHRASTITRRVRMFRFRTVLGPTRRDKNEV